MMTSKERRRALRKLHNPLWHGDDESAPSLTWLINRGYVYQITLIMYEEGHYLAILNPEGSFYIGQALQDIPFRSKKKFKIQWLEEVSSQKFKKLVSNDQICTSSIIDEVMLTKLSKTEYFLPENELIRINNVIDISKNKDLTKGSTSKRKLVDQCDNASDMRKKKQNLPDRDGTNDVNESGDIGNNDENVNSTANNIDIINEDKKGKSKKENLESLNVKENNDNSIVMAEDGCKMKLLEQGREAEKMSKNNRDSPDGYGNINDNDDTDQENSSGKDDESSIASKIDIIGEENKGKSKKENVEYHNQENDNENDTDMAELGCKTNLIEQGREAEEMSENELNSPDGYGNINDNDDTDQENSNGNGNDSSMEDMCDDIHNGNRFEDNESDDSHQSNNKATRNKTSKQGNKKRTYDERHSCLYCSKMVNKMSKHLINMHKTETSIQRIMSMEKNSKERKEALEEIRKEGDYYYNCEVMATKTGKLILLRRSTEEEDENEEEEENYHNYGPCPQCLGFMMKNHIWHHLKYNCRKGSRTNDSEGKSMAMAESEALLHSTYPNNVSDEFRENILNKFKGTDEIPYICRTDELIIQFGVFHYEKYGPTQNELVRQKMRQLARLVIKCKYMKPLQTHGERRSNISHLKDCIKTKNFDHVVKAVKEICKSTTHLTERPTLEQAPSLALKLGHSLRKCCNIVRGLALRNRDKRLDEEMQAFLHLMDLEWSAKISSAALSTLERKKFNITQLLPITSDLLTLNKYIQSVMISSTRNLEENLDESVEESYFNLSCATLSRLMLFNKRRSGEAAKLTVAQYRINPDWTNTDELKATLTPIENKLAKRLKLINIIGKRGRKVPLIITPDCQSAISLLLEVRDKIPSIRRDNPYLFPVKNSDKHMRGDRCLHKMCSDADLQEPERVTSTRLRKYMATVIQLFDLTETETDWLARHLGHDVRVHREFYRLQESTVELAKISRILLAVDEGRANEFAGKKLDDINTEELPELYESEDENPLTIASDQKSVNQKSAKTCPETKTKAQRNGVKTNAVRKHKLWSAEEKQLVLVHFRKNIKLKIVPNKEECEEFLERNQIVGRSWRNVKDCVYNHIKSLKKHLKS